MIDQERALGLGEAPYGVLTPYPIPEALREQKVPNLGDGFILRAIERLVGTFAPAFTFSPRIAPGPEAQAVLAARPAVLVAGANQLRDQYTVWPGLTASHLRSLGLRIVPFGIGLHGDPAHTERLSDATKEVLLAMHERIEFSSWRCPHTVALLVRELPQLAPQLLMTGCPVVYDGPLLEGQPFAAAADHVAVTTTERGDFWARETAVIDFVARVFPRARRSLVLHQNWSPPRRLELLRHRWLPQAPGQLDPWQRLRQHAVQKDFRVVCPADADACMSFYDGVDLHVGSRLHAHLLCLSRAKRSWLVPVDGRSTGIAEALDFPLCQPEALEGALGFEFERVRARAREGYVVMRRFVESLPR
jgi:hypothetical protein